MESAGTTIVAIATPPGPAERGILRVSGPGAAELVAATLREAVPAFDPRAVRQLVRGRLDDGGGTQPVTVLWMRGPRSFTREDVAELHLPGAEPLLARALGRLLELGAVAARPGEFTRRAFLNGRLDLSRAEGVLAMTEAGNEAERAAAALLLDGGLEELVGEARERLLVLATLCEASLDFDESETGEVPRAELAAAWDAADAALADTLRFETRRAPPSALPRVLLSGAPNAGKSTLWNALTGGDALVADEAGTTRDALEGRWSLGAETCVLIDGPGRELEAHGPAAGAQRLWERAHAHADLVVWVADACAEPGEPPPGAALAAWSRVDRPDARPTPDLGLFAIPVSARTGEGLDALRGAVAGLLGGARDAARAGGEGGPARFLFERHRAGLERARAALREGASALAAGAGLDLVAEAVRGALGALDELSGHTTAEDVLGSIFERFCLGK